MSSRVRSTALIMPILKQVAATGLLLALLIAPRVHTQVLTMTYNRADSTIYHTVVAYDSISEFRSFYVYRFKDEGRVLERSPLVVPDGLREHYSLEPMIIFPTNSPGRLYMIALNDLDMPRYESVDGGDSWQLSDAPFGYRLGASGELPNEFWSFGGGAFFHTLNNWESFDTIPVPARAIFGDQEEYTISCGQSAGELRRMRSNGDSLAFSSDYGHTWVQSDSTGYFQNTVSPYCGPSDEVYLDLSYNFFCLRDSGRTLTHVINLRDYYDYWGGDWGWYPSRATPTERPGELFVVVDSFSVALTGLRMHLYHVTDYGANVTLYSYNLPDYEPAEPEILGVDDRSIEAVRFPFIQTFPSPFNSSLSISYSSPTNAPLSISLVDLNGRMLQQNWYPGTSSGKGIATLGTTALPSGNYFLIVGGKEKGMVTPVKCLK